MNDLYCQMTASGITPDEEFSNRYELKLKGTDNLGNPVSLLQGDFRSKNEQETPSREENYGWEPVGEQFRIAISRD